MKCVNNKKNNNYKFMNEMITKHIDVTLLAVVVVAGLGVVVVVVAESWI